MIDKYVVEHFALKMNIEIKESMKRHIDLELFLKLAFEKGSLSPSSEIDETWHNFILHTRLYEKYCIENFGQFIHHNPFLIKKSSNSSCNTDEQDQCDTALSMSKGQLSHCDSSSCDSRLK